LDNYFVDVSCADSSKFDVLTDEEVWHLVDEIQAATDTMTNKQLDRLEKSAGLNFAPYGLLADHEVRSDLKPSASLYDAMHCFYSSGIVGVEVNLFVKSCEQNLGISKEVLGDMLAADWSQPKTQGKSANERRLSVADKQFGDQGWKASASVQVGVLPVLTYVASEVILPRLAADHAMTTVISSFLSLCRAHHILQSIKRGNEDVTTSCRDLKQALQEHLSLFQQARGRKYIKPKHHYVAHIPDRILSISLSRFFLFCQESIYIYIYR